MVGAISKDSIKNRILESAVHLFHQKGYHGVAVDEIVEHAKTSKGGFYYHFKSKDVLLYEIHDVFISHLLNETKRVHIEYSEPVDLLFNMLKSFTKIFEIYQRHITVFYEENAYLLPEYKMIIKDKRTKYRQLIEKVIDVGKKRGQFRDNISTTISTMAIIGIINWSYKWYRPYGSLTMEEIITYFNDFILRGMLTEKGLNEAILKGYVLQ